MDETEQKPCGYRVNRQDQIVEVSDNWLAFALANQAGESCHPDRIVGRPISKFIAGAETRHLYGLIVDKIRKTAKPIAFAFRCDAPDRQRFCQMTITPVSEGGLEFVSRVERTVSRPAIPLLAPDHPRSGELLKICSVCKRIAVPPYQWYEVEDALRILKLFNLPTLPQITHVNCPDCFRSIMDKLDTP